MQPTGPVAPELERRFGEALAGAAAVAGLGPSSHNCQPWGLARLVSEDAREAAAALLGRACGRDEEYLVLALDRRRELVALPAHAVEMRVSCGAYWRTLLRGLAAQGWVPSRMEVSSNGCALPVRGWPPEWSPLCVAAVRYGEGSGERFEDLHALARDRRTRRGPYRTEPLAAGLLDALETARPVAQPQPDAVVVQHLTSRDQCAEFAAFCARRAGRDFSHPRAWRETHSYLRWSPAHAESEGDGFTLPQLFGPLSPVRHLAKRVLLHPRVLLPLCRLGYHHRLAGGLAATVRTGTPALVAMGFTAARPGPADALAGGARLADYWLAATEAGLALHPVSVVVQHEDLRQELRDQFGLEGRTFFVSRLGRPVDSAAPTARRPDATAHLTL
ncbi:RedV protein [Streptomyces spirodelae]|uniref:RedV protein n=1 Tax=Streptomyces spirodelae TaxID=2812904 RepID=A0ABS3WZS0_9ACTN|nr:RedV protein [Streptomyces spirodelae]MBO8188629.1 RedV protein [Streptomyces spirodelae]